MSECVLVLCCLALVALVALVHQTSAIYNAEAMHKLLDRLGDKQLYRKEIRPGLPPGPNDGVNALDVQANIYMRNFLAIDMERGRMDTQVTFRQSWVDDRLADVCGSKNDNSTACAQLGGEDVDLAWRPDTFFRNELEVKVHQDLRRNNYLRVFPGGRLLYSVRMTLSTSCYGAAAKHRGYMGYRGDIQIEFNYFLRDRDWLQQHKNETFVCELKMASYGNTKENINYNWKNVDPVQCVKDLSIPNQDMVHVLSAYTTDYCDVLTSTGEYSCLMAKFAFTKTLHGF